MWRAPLAKEKKNQQKKQPVSFASWRKNDNDKSSVLFEEVIHRALAQTTIQRPLAINRILPRRRRPAVKACDPERAAADRAAEEAAKKVKKERPARREEEQEAVFSE